MYSSKDNFNHLISISKNNPQALIFKEEYKDLYDVNKYKNFCLLQNR